MASAIENKNMEHKHMEGETATGTLQFDDEKKYCYILMDDGRQIPTTPMFDFFNGFISSDLLFERMPAYYTQLEIEWFMYQFGRFRESKLSAAELLLLCKRNFGF